MHLLSLLARILLCIGLALNGVAVAHPGGARTVVADAQPGAVAAPCHEMGGQAADAVHAAVLDRDAGDAGGDCCAGGACACGCLVQASAMPGACVEAWTPVAPACIAPTADAWHRAPRLPHLIRPPIG